MSTAPAPVGSPTPRRGRAVHHLNFGWRYCPDAREEYVTPVFDDREWASVTLPHPGVELPYNCLDDAAYQVVSTYRRALDPGARPPGSRAILHFEGVMCAAEVFIDGVRAGGHEGGYTPFALDITDGLADRGPSVLAVVVDSTERPDIPPFGGFVDFLGYGGIYREVRLEIVAPVHIADVVVRTRGVLTPAAGLDVAVDLANHLPSARPAALSVDVLRNGIVVASASAQITLPPGGPARPTRTVHTVVTEVGAVEVWGPGLPELYDVVVTATDGEDHLDRVDARIGFREATFRADGFYLNGVRTKLRGLNRHQAFPYVGGAMPRSAQARDAEILARDLGVNVVRTSHYPQSRHFLDACDELGLMVFEEMPGWQHVGGPEWKANALADVEAMIRRDRNRPCVIAWGVRVNESPDDDAFYSATNRLARALDPTRPTGGVRNLAGSTLLEDIYTYNDFLHRGTNAALAAARSITGRGVPYLVTEHTGHMFPTKTFDNEERRVEHALRHLRVLEAMYAAPDVAGAIGWCLVDYATHRDFGSGDRICYHGVLDSFRVPKLAAAVYASQQDQLPVLTVASAMTPGERDAAELREVYVFTNCDRVRLSKDGHEIGTYGPDRANYPTVPHPPVVISDLIGSLIADNERFRPADAERVKRVLHAITRHGPTGLRWHQAVTLAWLRLRYRITQAEAVRLYTTYIEHWGTSTPTYLFEGLVGDAVVTAVTVVPDGVGHLSVRADADVLVEDVTYDVCRVVVEHVDDVGRTRTFSDEVVSVSTDGPGEVIGPRSVALVGGSRAFWVRTTGHEGALTVTIASERFGSQQVRFRVEKRTLPTNGA